MSFLGTILLFASSLSSANAIGSTAYGLKSKYDSTNFFDSTSFSFYDGWDTFTDGLALYQPKEQATSSGLAKLIYDKKVYLGVDTTDKLKSSTAGAGNGRKSVRLEGTETFDNGLFVADFDHLPANACGQWPALYVFFR